MEKQTPNYCRDCKIRKERKMFTRLSIIMLIISLSLSGYAIYNLNVAFFTPERIMDMNYRLLTDLNNDEMMKLRNITLPMIYECDNTDTECITKSLFVNLPYLRYTTHPAHNYTTAFPPIVTYNTQAGDCKDFAKMYHNMLESIGVHNSSLILTENHVYNIVTDYNNNETKYLVDFAKTPSEYIKINMTQYPNLNYSDIDLYMSDFEMIVKYYKNNTNITEIRMIYELN